MNDNPNKVLDKAVQYVAENLTNLATELLETADGSPVLEGGKFYVLCLMLKPINRQAMSLAETLVKEAALRQAATQRK